MLESLDGQARHAEALETHDHLVGNLRGVGEGIQRSCNKLNLARQQMLPVLQHAAITLQHVNPTAANTIMGLIHATQEATRDMERRASELLTWIPVIPKPSPPADSPAETVDVAPPDESQEADEVPASPIQEG